jgi:UDP-glucose 4-epimerase
MIERVLITGVAGFVGSNLLDYLIEHTSWQIHGIDNLSTGHRRNIAHHINHPRFSFAQGSLFELRSLRPYQVVFHLAALPRIQPSFEWVTEHIRENLLASVHLLELCTAEGHYPRIVNSSSSAIYGTPTEIPTTERAAVSCLSPYAFQKYETEKYFELLATRYPLNFVHLRYFNPYGPRSFNPENKFNAYSSVVGIFLHRHRNGEPLLVTGDGTQERDFVHVSDLAWANYLAAIHPGPLNTAFNIGASGTLSIIDLARAISDRIEFIEAREGEARITYADISKAREILGWEPSMTIQEYLQAELV